MGDKGLNDVQYIEPSKTPRKAPLLPLFLILACQSDFCPVGTEWDGSSCHVVLCSVVMEDGDGTCIEAPEYVGDDTDDSPPDTDSDWDSDTDATDTDTDTDTIIDTGDTTYFPDTSWDTGAYQHSDTGSD
ncbi:MAG: hypothetical protein HN348_17270 [Proteobacteria bacterium]|nr:hypothetical protein [Pseudomonadota bacterium]